MSKMNRRDFLKLGGAAGAAGVLGGFGARASAQLPSGVKAHVIVVGGGFGGATCAKYIRRGDPSIQVTLIEQNKTFVTCPFSNLYLGGLRTMESITHSFDSLRSKHGVNVVHDKVASVDPAKRTVKLAGGTTLHYDKLVLSPGIALKYDSVGGYSKAVAEKMPHAWKAGPQTVLLKKQLDGMRNGGVFAIVAPPNPFRCPPGPYERASMVAYYLAKHKPKSKILILDAKDSFSKQGLFQAAWDRFYRGMIEWVPAKSGGKVRSVDVKNSVIDAELAQHKVDVANVIPAQRAADIAVNTGLTDDKGWCPVDPGTFESKIHKNIHVIGDAAIAGALPKSGFAANSEAKMCAASIVAAVRGDEAVFGSFANTCYSLITPDYGISIAGVYRITDKGITSVPGSGGVSPKDANDEFRKDEAKYASGWYDGISADIWG